MILQCSLVAAWRALVTDARAVARPRMLPQNRRARMSSKFAGGDSVGRRFDIAPAGYHRPSPRTRRRGRRLVQAIPARSRARIGAGLRPTGSSATRWRSSPPASRSSARGQATAATSASPPTRSTRCRSIRRSIAVEAGARGSASLAAFEAAERYAVNVLSARPGRSSRGAFRGRTPIASPACDYRLGWADAPLIDGCVAWFECRHHARHRAGDHVLFIGEVVTCERRTGQRPRVPPRPLRHDGSR